MRNRSVNWLMLTAIALQGTGLLHALHLVTEHAPRHGHDCGSCTQDHAGAPSALSSGHARPAFHDAHGLAERRTHDPATCTVCRAMASVKAMPAVLAAGPGLVLPPALQSPTPHSFTRRHNPLSALRPRAPPAPILSASA